MSVESDNVEAGPPPPRADDATAVAIGDRVRWNGCWMTVSDIADYHEAGVYVVLTDPARRHLPLTVGASDLSRLALARRPAP